MAIHLVSRGGGAFILGDREIQNKNSVTDACSTPDILESKLDGLRHAPDDATDGAPDMPQTTPQTCPGHITPMSPPLKIIFDICSKRLLFKNTDNQYTIDALA